MIYRAFVVGIVLFWVWMSVRLALFEFAPGDAQTLPVPTARVWKLLFDHEELSALTLYNSRLRLGDLQVQPRKRTPGPGGRRQLTCTGAFAVDLPGVGAQRIVLHGSLELDDHDDMQHVELAASFREQNRAAPGMTVFFDGEPPRGQWHYAVRQGNAVVKENTGTVEMLLDDPALRAFGFNPQSVGQLSRQQAAGMAITARHGTLRTSGEEVETYVVTLRQGDGLESSIHINQLGQILAVKTFLGYNLYTDAFAP